MSTHINAGGTLRRIGRGLVRLAAIMAIAINAIMLVVSITASVMTGHYLPSVIAIVLSLGFWGAIFGLIKIIRVSRTNARAADEREALTGYRY